MSVKETLEAVDEKAIALPCPYCGIGMTILGSTLPSGDEYYWYQCKGCRSTSPVADTLLDAIQKALIRVKIQ